MSFGAKLKSIRSERKYSLAQLAKVTGLTKGYLSKVEHDKVLPKHENIKKLADGLKVNYAELLEIAGYLEEGTFNQRVNTLMDMAAERNKNVDSAGTKNDFKDDSMANFPELNAKKIILNVPEKYNIQGEIRETQNTDALDLYYLAHLAKQDDNINLKYKGKDLNEEQIQKAMDMLSILFREE